MRKRKETIIFAALLCFSTTIGESTVWQLYAKFLIQIFSSYPHSSPTKCLLQRRKLRFTKGNQSPEWHCLEPNSRASPHLCLILEYLTLWGTGLVLFACERSKAAHVEMPAAGTSLVVWRLRLHTPDAGGPGSIPGQGSRPQMLQWSLKISRAAAETRCSQIN